MKSKKRKKQNLPKINFGYASLDKIPKAEWDELYAYAQNIIKYGFGFEVLYIKRKVLIEKTPSASYVTSRNQKYWCDDRGMMHSYGDRPSQIKSNDTMVWHKHGVEHRGGDMPSFVGSNGTTFMWKIDGCYRRNYNWKPAMITQNNVYFYRHDGYNMHYRKEKYLEDLVKFVNFFETLLKTNSK